MMGSEGLGTGGWGRTEGSRQWAVSRTQQTVRTPQCPESKVP